MPKAGVGMPTKGFLNNKGPFCQQAGQAELPHLFPPIQKVLSSIGYSFMQLVQVGGHSHEVAVHIVENDLQGGLLPFLGVG